MYCPKMKFSITDFFSNSSHLLKKSLMEDFTFCAVALIVHKLYENKVSLSSKAYHI